MPLQKILFKPGVNRENTRYTTEGGWYECDKIRFRQGNPETLGGWVPYSLNTFQGVCRSLNNWVTLNNENLVGVGTNLKFYIENGGAYYNITPIRETATINNNPFALTASTTVTVTDTSHGCSTGDFVTFSGAVDIGGGGTNVTAAVLNQEFQVTVVDVNTYTITISVTPNATAIAGSPGGGSAVVAAYQLNVGPALAVPLTGWGAGAWDQAGSTWGNTTSTTQFVLRQWNQQNYGEDLVFGPRGGGLYYWDATGGVSTRGVLLNSLGGTVTFTTASPTVVTLTNLLTEGTAVQFSVSSGGTLPTGISAATTYYLFNVLGLTANLIDISGNLINVTGAGSGTFSISLLVDVPTVQNYILVSDTSRFIFAFGCNDYGAATADPMLIRWSDQDNVREWTPDATNQAGSIRLSRGSEIVTALQTRQEVVVFTDSSVYSVQYLGPPVVWSTQILGDNISIAGQNAAIIASGVIYWMGVDKFYAYDGRVQTLNCDVRRYVFSDFNLDQRAQVFAGTNEAFNEVWWLYCSADASYPDRYVIYNYLERIWYYGTLSRSAWLDSGLSAYPYATTYDSSTQTGRLIAHENGINDNTDGTAVALSANISSSEFDINDGHNFGFVWRIIPDITFNNSTNSPTNLSPRVTMTLRALYNSGSGQIDSANGVVAQGANYVITEEFTGQIFTRVRGRQMIFEISSNQLNTCWQLGAPRIDIKPDGRR
jgi:hypothetical protein